MRITPTTEVSTTGSSFKLRGEKASRATSGISLKSGRYAHLGIEARAARICGIRIREINAVFEIVSVVVFNSIDFFGLRVVRSPRSGWCVCYITFKYTFYC